MPGPRFRLTRLQLLLLLLLAALVIAGIVARRRPATGPTSPSVSGVAFDPAAVEEVVIERGSSRARIERTGAGFILREPYPDRADERFVQQSLHVASTLRPIRTLPEIAAAAFGLDPPRARWSCSWTGGGFAIDLGDSLPTGGGRYARIGSDPHVQIVDSFLSRRYLAPPLNDLHDPRAVTPDVGPIDSVRIETREERILVEREGASRWIIRSPVVAEASAPRLGRALQALLADELQGFRPITDATDLAPLGLAPPRAVWTFHQGGRSWTVLIGHPTPDQQRVVLVPDGRRVLAEVDSESFRDWVDGLARLREGSMMSASADSVVAVTIRAGARHRRLELGRDGRWRTVAPGDALQLETQAVQIAVQNLSKLQAVRFLDSGAAKEAGREDLAVRLSLLGGGADSILFGPARGDLVTARSPRQPGTAFVASSAAVPWRLWMDSPPIR